MLWFSERDNWGQLYLYDLTTGKLKNQVTHGDGDVTQVLHVDEKARMIYFLAVGKEAGRDPYFSALYRVNFDGTGMKLLTPEDADHDVTMSPDGRYFSTWLRRPRRRRPRWFATTMANVLMDVAQQDITKLRAAGWKPLTPITVKARDGKTDLYGFLFKPTNFDRGEAISHHRPCLSGAADGLVRQPQLLGRAQGHAVAGGTGLHRGVHRRHGNAGRSKSFHDALFGDMADNTIPDQVAGIKELAAKYPWIDLDRVGHLRALGRRRGDGGGDVSLPGLLQSRHQRERQPRQPRVRRRLGGEVDRTAEEESPTERPTTTARRTRTSRRT